MDRTIFSDYLVRRAILEALFDGLPSATEFCLFLANELINQGWLNDELLSPEEKDRLERFGSALGDEMLFSEGKSNGEAAKGKGEVSERAQSWSRLSDALKLIASPIEDSSVERACKDLRERLSDSPWAQVAILLILKAGLYPIDSTIEGKAYLAGAREFVSLSPEIEAGLTLCGIFLEDENRTSPDESSAEPEDESSPETRKPSEDETVLELSRAIRMVETGELASALSILERMAKERPEWPLISLWYAKCAALACKQRMMDLPMIGSIPPDISEDIEKARLVLTDAMKQETASRTASYVGKGLLTTFDLMTEDSSKAMARCEAMLELEPEDPVALLGKGCVLAKLGQYNEAISSLQRAEGLPSEPEELVLAAILQDASNAKLAVKLLSERLESVEVPPAIDMLLLVQASYRAGQLDVADQLFKKLEMAGCSRAMILWLSADRLLLAGDYSKARGILQRALSVAEEEKSSARLSSWITWELARLDFYDGQVLSACDLFKKIVPETGDTPVVRDHILALFYAGLDSAAYERARRLRLDSDEAAIPGITEVEINHLVLSNQLREARILLQKLIETAPTDKLRATLFRIHASLRESQQAWKVLDVIDLSKLDEATLTEIETIKQKLEPRSD